LRCDAASSVAASPEGPAAGAAVAAAAGADGASGFGASTAGASVFVSAVEAERTIFRTRGFSGFSF
jgi:hypothetical protein